MDLNAVAADIRSAVDGAGEILGRRKMAKLMKFGSIAAAVLLAATIAVPASAQKAVRLGTSSIGSSFYVTAVGMSRLIQEHAKMNVTVEPVGGSAANMFGIAAGRIDLAMGNSGATYDAYHGIKPYRKKINLRLLISGNPTLRWFMVRKGSGISQPGDMVGKVISSSRKPLPELQQIMNALIKVYNLPSRKIKQVGSVNSGEVARAFRAGTIDAAAFPFALRMPIASKLFADDVIEPLMIPDDKFKQVLAQLPDKFSVLRVPANNFKNQPHAFNSLMMTTQLAAIDKTPEETAYQVVKAVLGHHSEFVKYHATARYWNVENTLKNAKVPYHPGAIRYFKEIGKWTPELQKLQEKLLKNQ